MYADKYSSQHVEGLKFKYKKRVVAITFNLFSEFRLGNVFKLHYFVCTIDFNQNFVSSLFRNNFIFLIL